MSIYNNNNNNYDNNNNNNNNNKKKKNAWQGIKLYTLSVNLNDILIIARKHTLQILLFYFQKIQIIAIGMNFKRKWHIFFIEGYQPLAHYTDAKFDQWISCPYLSRAKHMFSHLASSI